ncbi:L,D-transpeptidase [Oscillatoria sp. FACHB-1407]|uniref:L,D-transpeptidase n=1 Tax=Oscillatoria sp. FACHB-1407 TaxID=2692847 RepID=UPI0016884E28|nr:L,D-transpeptidase [Oscillatoria sp. FACHB-1407]MBD2460120.1 L,D-transpeptidase [Oscillatoria sp. FACHB-1407]
MRSRQFYQLLFTGLVGAIALVSFQPKAQGQAAFAGYVDSPQAIDSQSVGLQDSRAQSDLPNNPAQISRSNFVLQPQLPVLEVPPLRPDLPDPSRYELRLVLRLGERRVYVYRGNEPQISYPVAVGREGWETPTGNFQVMEMVTNPGWTNPLTRELVPPGPTNPLGERWIAFWTDGKDYIGFHGTPNRESVGQAVSHGCIRMLNEHVRQLYDMVTPGTQVIVMP